MAPMIAGDRDSDERVGEEAEGVGLVMGASDRTRVGVGVVVGEVDHRPLLWRVDT